MFLRNSGTPTHRKAKETNELRKKAWAVQFPGWCKLLCHSDSPVSCRRVSSISMLPPEFVADHSQEIKFKV